MKISVFINTLNEASRLRHCLDSVRWADEIVVVDMHSDDETVAIAKEYTDKIFYFDRLGYCEPARKFAAEQTTGEWILNIDADEIVTNALRLELCRIAQENRFNAVYIPRKNYFWGEEMRYSGCGMLQDRPLRFYKRGAVVFTSTIHAGIQLSPSARVLKLDNVDAHLLHFSYNSIGQYWQKMDKYTQIEAKALFDQGTPYNFKIALKESWDAFWKRYVKKGKGHKDGQWGLMYCVWTAVYKLNVYAHYLLMKTYKTSDYHAQIEKKYDDIIQIALQDIPRSSSGDAHRN